MADSGARELGPFGIGASFIGFPSEPLPAPAIFPGRSLGMDQTSEARITGGGDLGLDGGNREQSSKTNAPASRLGSATFRDFLFTCLAFPPLGFKPRLLWLCANVSTYKFTFNKGGVSQGDKTVFKTEDFSSLLGLAAEIKRRQNTSVPTPPPSFTHGVSSLQMFPPP